jgi:hypothetical protein
MPAGSPFWATGKKDFAGCRFAMNEFFLKRSVAAGKPNVCRIGEKRVRETSLSTMGSFNTDLASGNDGEADDNFRSVRVHVQRALREVSRTEIALNAAAPGTDETEIQNPAHHGTG